MLYIVLEGLLIANVCTEDASKTALFTVAMAVHVLVASVLA